MSIDQNKAVVRRFITEVLAGGKVDLVDELLAPDYRNEAMSVDREHFKEMLAGLAAMLPVRRFEIKELVAEGDSVVGRFVYDMTDTRGTQTTLRGLAYYRLAGGKIVEDDPITSPDLMEVLGPLMAAPSTT